MEAATVRARLSNITRDATPGRHLFGSASLAFGLITLAWHNHKDGDQLRYIPVAAAWIFGGSTIQFRRTAKTGAVVLCAVYLAFALLCVPPIVAAPRIYDRWGNFFEQLSLLTGAALIYAPVTLNRIGRISLGMCAGSFALEQALYLNNTIVLVPKWLPPDQRFWAIATTVPFVLAAVALLANRLALLATRLLTIMLASFGLLVWVPLLVSQPRSHTNWSEAAETFAIAGTAWILADSSKG